MLTEEASRGVALRVHHVHQLVRILRERSSENDDLEVLRHFLHEVLCAWSFHDVDVGGAAIDVDRDGVVRIAHVGELTVDQRFIEVEDEGLAATDVLWLGPQEAMLSGSSPEYEIVPAR